MKSVTKKYLFSLLFFIILTIALGFAAMYLTIQGCFNSSFDDTEHNVELVLIEKNGTKIRKILTSREKGATIYNPNDYVIYPSLIEGYVIENDTWYSSENMSTSIYFPYTMPDNDLKLYASVRPLKYLHEVNFATPTRVENFFKNKSTLKDEYWDSPNTNNETSYYEISEYSVGAIKNVMRYYPAKQEIKLMRGYSITENIGNMLIIQDEFSIGISINLSNKTIICKGIYSRKGATYSNTAESSVTITYNVEKISIDDTAKPLFPNFATINYSSNIDYTDNYIELKELWDSDGHNYAEKCYTQADALLKSLNKQLLVLS